MAVLKYFKHFDKLPNKLVCLNNVVPVEAPDTDLIAECQAVRDNDSLSQRTRIYTATFEWGSAQSDRLFESEIANK